MKTIMLCAGQDVLRGVMTRAAGGFTQCVAWEQEVSESRVRVSVFVREKAPL